MKRNHFFVFVVLIVVVSWMMSAGSAPALESEAPSPSSSANVWNQFGGNAQRTHYVPNAIPTPWRLQWIWNGSDANGNIPSGKFGLPRNSQPVVGGGRVYVAAGTRGVYAINNLNGRVVWNRQFAGDAVLSTPAYDGPTNSLYVVTRNGILYRLHASTGAILGQYATGQRSNLPLPPALVDTRVYFSMGRYVHAVNKQTMRRIWRYDAGGLVETPPAYSASRGLVVVVAHSLHVHAIRATNGTRAWRVKPTVLQPGDPGSDINRATARNGWPVVAERHGVVFVRYRLHWESLWSWSHTLVDNEQWRAFLENNPEEQALFALDLDDGSAAFIPNVGNGGFGDGGYLPIGPMPVIKHFPDNTEVAYVVMRGGCAPPVEASCDPRGDSHLGEMVLDEVTVPGYQAGYVRYIRNTFFPTDEQPFLSMAGNHLFAGHWEAGIAHRITDRSPARGDSRYNPITTADLPHVVASQDNDACGTGFRQHRYCDLGLHNTRIWPGGFYNYWQKGAVYDQYWSEYASWVVGGNTVYFVSTDGAVLAFRNGHPTAANRAPQLAVFRDPLAALEGVLRSMLPPPAVISYQEAARYAGREVTVEGELRYVFNNRQGVLLGFSNPHQGTFKARIMRSVWSNFEAPPEQLYRVGMTVRVRGVVTWYQGDPAIYVQQPEQIVVIAEPALAANE